MSPPQGPRTVPGSLVVGTIFVLCALVAGAAYARFAIAGALLVVGVTLIVRGTRVTRTSTRS